MANRIVLSEDFEWGRMLPLHIALSSLTLLIYFAPTLYLHLRGLLVAGYKVPPYWFLAWGYSFGLGLQWFTPKIWCAHKRLKRAGF